MKIKEGFILDANTAVHFWEIVIALKLQTLEERQALLWLLVKEKKAGYLRDVDEYIKDKKVLRIKGK